RAVRPALRHDHPHRRGGARSRQRRLFHWQGHGYVRPANQVREPRRRAPRTPRRHRRPPPPPALTATSVPSADELWHRAAAPNPHLEKMRAMVEMTVASVDVARQTGRPNFAIGAMVDLKASPLMVRPTAAISLPIWREKIAATIAAAEARRDAAAARVNAEQLT